MQASSLPPAAVRRELRCVYLQAIAKTAEEEEGVFQRKLQILQADIQQLTQRLADSEAVVSTRDAQLVQLEQHDKEGRTKLYYKCQEM